MPWYCIYHLVDCILICCTYVIFQALNYLKGSLLSTMACFRYWAWVGFTDEKKAELFKHFLVDSGQRQPPKMVQFTSGGIRVLQPDHQPDDDRVQHAAPMTMQSTTSSLHVLNTSAVGRKPGTVRRPRSTHTTVTTTKRSRDKKIKTESDSDS